MKVMCTILVITLVLVLQGTASADTEVRVAVGFGVVIGCVTLFLAYSFGGRHASHDEDKYLKVSSLDYRRRDLQSLQLEYRRDLSRNRAAPGMVTVLSW